MGIENQGAIMDFRKMHNSSDKAASRLWKLTTIVLLLLVARPGFTSLKMFDLAPAVGQEGQDLLDRLSRLASADISTPESAPTKDELKSEIEKAYALAKTMAIKAVGADQEIAREAPFRKLHEEHRGFAGSSGDQALYDTDYVSPVSSKMLEAVNILKAGL